MSIVRTAKKPGSSRYVCHPPTFPVKGEGVFRGARSGCPLRFQQKHYFFIKRNRPWVSLSLVKYNAPSGPTATPTGRAQRLPSAR